MTATNIQLDGMSNNATSVTLAAVAEAVDWQHAMETAFSKRPAPRAVIYPPSLMHLQAVLDSGDPSVDMENGHELAYEKILSACGKYGECPRFFPSDSQEFGGLDIAASVPKWMNTAEQVSVGGTKQVLEDGADVCNSERDPDHENHGSILSDIFVGVPVDSDGNPISQGYKLSAEQATALRAPVSPPPVFERKATPLNSDDDD
jgi:hypothetical protein